MLKALLPFIDDINILDQNKQNAAHIACKYGELECLKILGANGINLEQKDSLGMQPIHVAAMHNSEKLIEFLFEMGVSINEKCMNGGKLPFHYAAEHGSIESLKLMSSYYIDISIPDKDKNTAAHLSAKYDHLECIKFLASLGLPVDRVKNKFGRNLLHVCCLHGSVKSFHWLLEYKNIDLELLDGKFRNIFEHYQFSISI
jgi:ankyrin repeat protein